ncbi:hypothetical protein NA57DRAFT_78560 [Rhizodiscina lignyota]|uniref:Thioesterase domain-containing protein n=1 Tax=Rhizodiscina lignyota TaxID=1504668 RepID=A0A9P4I965_9PEZI|nr:hypothetical protein NA57DRAFT_78560 [Rhizodiscina lignyota]
MTIHPDFDTPWCKKLLADPNLKWREQVPDRYHGKTVTNAMFEQTLYTEHGIRAHLAFSRPSEEPDAIEGTEACFLMSIGNGLDGKRGRAHGGFNALVLDQVSGSASHHMKPDPNPPATATITVDFKAPINTPCVIFSRAWVIEIDRRKVWVKAVIEDGEGHVYASAKSLFVAAKPSL